MLADPLITRPYITDAGVGEGVGVGGGCVQDGDGRCGQRERCMVKTGGAGEFRGDSGE